MPTLNENLQITLQVLHKLKIKEITDNSKEVDEKTAFFCNEKAQKMGYYFEAIAKGSGVVFFLNFKFEIKEKIFEGVKYTEILLPSLEFYAELLKFFYSLQTLVKIGVTGTNGKSSTVHFGATICSLMGKKSATIGTNGICVFENGKIISTEEIGLTTPTLTKFYKALWYLEKQKVRFVWAEISSIGIEQGRVLGIEFDASCFTNLTQDHLDYHHTMEEYFWQKSRLFSEFTKRSGAVVLNEKSEFSSKIAQIATGKTIIFYGSENFTICNNQIRIEINKNEAHLNTFGAFQVQNFFCAVKVLEFLGFDLQKIAKIVEKISPPEGRMQPFFVGQTHVIIDFAHTPDALENVLKNINGEKIIVFGCGGNRDKTKRKIMGQVASTLAKQVIITNDNPRNENPQTIANEIAEGCQNNFEIILDRKKAIIHGIEMCKNQGITLIIAGKGNENYQIIGNKKISYSDVDVIKSLKK